MYCVPCATNIYGKKRIQAIINGTSGSERFTDQEGNPFGVVLDFLRRPAHHVLWWMR